MCIASSAVLLAGCSRSAPATVPVTVPETRHEIRTDTVAIEVGAMGDVERLIARVPQTAALRLDRDSLVPLRIGATIKFSELPIVLLDSTGQVMGRLPIYDAMVPPNPTLRRDGMGVHGVAPGSQVITLRVPGAFRKGATTPAPAVRVTFVVVE
jgi:hypothetical protein